jgi:AcrR family transcriptional regulator
MATTRTAPARTRTRPAKAAPPPEPEERSTRGARRKRETREKLLRAAFELIAERGVDAVAIQQITETADVGFGSFYNHFESKDAIYDHVFRAVFESFGEALDRLTESLEDPAEIIAVSIRHTIDRAHGEPLWRRFFLREGHGPRAMTTGLGIRLLRDIQRGIAEERFEVEDPMMALLVAGGTVMATVAANEVAPQFVSIGADTADLAERAASAILQSLGIRRREAEKIARKPLPPLELAPTFAVG